MKGARAAAVRIPAVSGGRVATGPAPAQISPSREHPRSLRGWARAGSRASVGMEGAQEDPAESSSSVPRFAEPAGSAGGAEVLPPEESGAAAKKLCGYLSKFGGKGPIRGWKSRWFFYDEKKCHLYYSRTAQDANPLDSIDLSTAVFDCKADAEEGTFEIKTANRIITLKVNGAVSPSFSARMGSQGTAGHVWVVTVNSLEQELQTLISSSEPWAPTV